MYVILLGSMFLLRDSISQIKIYSASATLPGVPGESLLCAHSPGKQSDNAVLSTLHQAPFAGPLQEELTDQNGLTFQGEAVGQERKCQDKTSVACLQGGAGDHVLSSPRKDITSPQWKGVSAGEVSYLSNAEESTVELMWASVSSHLDHVCPLSSVYFLFTSD